MDTSKKIYREISIKYLPRLRALACMGTKQPPGKIKSVNPMTFEKQKETMPSILHTFRIVHAKYQTHSIIDSLAPLKTV